jgi:hypothetical protein
VPLPEFNGVIFNILIIIMKKLKTAGLALALALGVSGAFVSHSAIAATKSAASYNWQLFDREGNPAGTLTNDTEVQAENATGCSSGTDLVCAHTTNATPQLIIYYKN